MKESNCTIDLSELEGIVGHKFNDIDLLLKALTHSSFCNETEEDISDNERLEFLGDAIISTVIAEAAFRLFPDAREGELTRLKSVVVAQPSLASTAGRLDIGRFLRLGHGAAVADRAATHPSVLCDAFEAVVGAIFLDAGFEKARDVVLRLLDGELERARREGRQIDPKTELQMLTYGLAHKPPSYSVVKMAGPAHAPIFTVEVTLPNGNVYRASGRTRKQAEQAAAGLALSNVRESIHVVEVGHENSEDRNGRN